MGDVLRTLQPRIGLFAGIIRRYGPPFTLLLTSCTLTPLSWGETPSDTPEAGLSLVDPVAQDFADEALTAPPDPTASKRDVSAYEQSIHTLESSQGAYAEGLAEQLLGLGQSLQIQGEHADAVAAFKRGVHLTRINQGLYSAQQIPLLQGLVESYTALGEWEQADDRQNYLFRVQRRALSGREDMSSVLMQHAMWQYEAYQRDTNSDGFLRLLSMWDYYRMAASTIAQRVGKTSVEMLPPLYGLVRTQYLIALHSTPDAGASLGSQSDYNERIQQGRFTSIQSRSYKQGREVINVMVDVYSENLEPGNPLRVESLVMLGDWMWFNGERTRATEVYQQALTELAARDDAQLQKERLFGTPVALPDVDGLRPLPVAPDTDGAVLLEYAVNEYGRVTDVELREGDEERARTLMRTLRKTRFRPRFDEQEPVRTEQILTSYAY